MQNTPRKHHFISQCYLKNFSDEKGNILTLDFERGRHFTTTPKNIAAERDFNLIESKAVLSFEIEKKLGELESFFASSIQNVITTEQFSERDYAQILFFIACYAIRNPYTREGLKQHISNKANMLQLPILPEGSQVLLEDEGGEKFEAIIKTSLHNGQAKTAIDINITRNQHIILEFETITERILPSLYERKWRLAKAPQDLFFITSESPVILMKPGSSTVEPLSFEDKNTILYFPLTRKFTLIGEFSSTIINSTQQISDKNVADMNNLILFTAKNQIFTPRADFKFSDGCGGIISGENIVKKLCKFRLQT
ncbi:MAG: DUF4238 domain-containing protein [Legionellales bacterium]|jgi:hypothetical protein